ncbi:hypothetical protein GC173_02095 [bacterium]|nr:hypothetical protein [bacterium]
MHQDLAARLFPVPSRAPFVVGGLALLPMLAVFVWILGSPVAPPTGGGVFVDSSAVCRLMGGGAFPVTARRLLPAQYSARTASRWVSLWLAVTAAVGFGAVRGRLLRDRLDERHLVSVPVDARRLQLFALIREIRCFLVPGLAIFLLLVTASGFAVVELTRQVLASDWELFERMQLDIIGSTAHFVALRFGQNFGWAALAFAVTLFLFQRWGFHEMLRAFRMATIPNEQEPSTVRSSLTAPRVVPE